VVLVALDTNVLDLVAAACASPAHVDAMEAMEPPPRRFDCSEPHQEIEALACYWLLAMAPAWRATLYTFSDLLYKEAADAPQASRLLRVAFDVLGREWQEPEFRAPDPSKRPKAGDLMAVGLKHADADHVADAIGIGCHRFLTNDKQLRNRSDAVEVRWACAIRRPSEFLVEAVRAGAPWTTLAPWPWESFDRIRDGQSILGNPGGAQTDSRHRHPG
jgi:hypothetical protein